MKSNLAQQTKTDNQDFLIGDVVVLTELCRNFESNDLFEVKGRENAQLWVIKSSNHFVLVSSKEITQATVAELKAKRRLTTSELSIAEVS